MERPVRMVRDHLMECGIVHEHVGSQRACLQEGCLDSLHAEVSADGPHGRLRRLGGSEHLAPLKHHVHARPHHAHHGARRLRQMCTVITEKFASKFA